jgi:hypothetical protein
MDPSQKEFAFQIMSWIYRTPRGLLMDELREALVVEDGDKEFNDEAISSPKYIVEKCAALVIYDDHTGVVRFSHETVQEYLQMHCEKDLLPAAALAKVCLTYLRFDVFDHFREKHSEYVAEWIQNNKFIGYSAEFWGLHTRGESEKDPHIQEAVLLLLSSENKKSSMLEIQSWFSDPWSEVAHSIPTSRTVLHVVCSEGLATICKLVLEGRLNASDRYMLATSHRLLTLLEKDH